MHMTTDHISARKTNNILQFVFSIYDLDKNGELTQDEINKVIAHISTGAAKVWGLDAACKYSHSS